MLFLYYTGLQAMIQFAWSLTLRAASQHPLIPGTAAACCEEDDDMIETAFQGQVFKFMAVSIIKSSAFSAEVSLKEWLPSVLTFHN